MIVERRDCKTSVEELDEIGDCQQVTENEICFNSDFENRNVFDFICVEILLTH